MTFHSSCSPIVCISVLGHHGQSAGGAVNPQTPQTPRLSASGTAPGGPGGPPDSSRLFDNDRPTGGGRPRATTPGAVITPGSNFDTSEVDSEDFLRSQLMRSASDEALGLKSDDLEDDVDSLRSPFYKPRTSLRGYPLESPQSPPSEDSSYQGSIPGSGPSDRSYNGGGGGSTTGANAASTRSGAGGQGLNDNDLEAIAAGYYMPDFKH